VSEPAPVSIRLAPSRARRAWLAGAGAAQAALAGVLGGAALQEAGQRRMALALAAAAVAATAVAAIAAARRPSGPLQLDLLPAPQVRKGRAPASDNGSLPARARARLLEPARAALFGAPGGGTVALAGAQAVHASASRIVLSAKGRQVTVWRDATDRDTFRRLCVRARWGGTVA
jgi:hypothetical protein